MGPLTLHPVPISRYLKFTSSWKQAALLAAPKSRSPVNPGSNPWEAFPKRYWLPAFFFPQGKPGRLRTGLLPLLSTLASLNSLSVSLSPLSRPCRTSWSLSRALLPQMLRSLNPLKAMGEPEDRSAGLCLCGPVQVPRQYTRCFFCVSLAPHSGPAAQHSHSK